MTERQELSFAAVVAAFGLILMRRIRRHFI